MGFWETDKHLKVDKKPVEPTNKYIAKEDIPKATFEILNKIANHLDIDLSELKNKWEHTEREQFESRGHDYDKFLQNGRKI